MTAVVNIALSRAVAELTELVAWWLQELRDIRLLLIERVTPQRSQRFIVDLSAASGTLGRLGDEGRSAALFELEHAHLPPLQEILAGTPPAKARVEIVLPPAIVLLFELRLPPLAEREVAGAVALQLERELPLPAAQLFVDWQVLSKAPDRSRVIAVAAARRTQVFHWRDDVHAWGWRVTRVGCRAADGQVRFNLLPPPVQRLSFAVGRREWVMAASALALCVAYLITVAGQWVYERAALLDQVELAREQAARVDDLQARIKTESRPVAALLELMELRGVNDALDSVTSAVPRDSWLYHMDIRALSVPTTIALEGYAPSSAVLMQELERSQRFQAVQLLEVANTDLGERIDRIKLQASLSASRAQ